VAVYVDDYLRRATVNGITAEWSHLFADAHDELLEFGKQLLLDPSWLQCEGTHREHFDVTGPKRARAIHMGAEAISYRQAGRMMVERRAVFAAAGQLPEPATAPAAEPEVEAAVGGELSAGPPRAWSSKTEQHSWRKLRQHWYQCWYCQLRKEHALISWRGERKWGVYWRWPDGAVAVGFCFPTPRCPGPVGW